MPSTPEHKADMYSLAQQRKAAGKPSWAYTLDLADVFRSDELSFEQRRYAIVTRIKASVWYKIKAEDEDVDSDLEALVEEISETEDEDEFNIVWEAIYDEADYDRCWIKTS